MIDKIESEYNRFNHFREKITELMQFYLLEFGSFEKFPEDVQEKFLYLFETLEKSNDDLIKQFNEYKNILQ